MATKVSGDNFLSGVIKPDEIKERALKPQEKKIESSKDQLDIVNKKAAELTKLKGLMSGFQSALKDMGNPVFNPFETATTITTTTDVGNSQEYFEVITGIKAEKRDYKVEVKQVAESAQVVFNIDGINTDFNKNNIFFDGDLTIRINDGVVDTDVVVNFDAQDNKVNKVLTKINNALQQQGNEFEAFAIYTGQDDFRIAIKAKEGVSKNITIHDYSNNEPLLGAVDIQQKSSSPFAQARILIDGQESISNSNKFENVLEDITIVAKKANNVNHYQIINVGVPDPTNFNHVFTTKLAPAVNSLITFVAEQRSKEYDPDKPEQVPPLATEHALLGMVDNLVTTLVGPAFEEIGIGLQTNTSPEVPPGTRMLDTIDINKYQEALKDLNKIKKQFVTNTVVERGNNTGNAELREYRMAFDLESSKTFPATYRGEKFKLDIELDADSAVTKVEATMGDNVVIEGQYDAKNNLITFPGKVIESLSLKFDPKGEAATTMTFDLTHTEGVINDVAKISRTLIDNDGNGVLKINQDDTKSRIDTQKKSIEALQKRYDQSQTKLENQLSQIDVIGMMAQIMSDAISKMLDFNN